jgi:hypothetical protein
MLASEAQLRTILPPRYESVVNTIVQLFRLAASGLIATVRNCALVSSIELRSVYDKETNGSRKK